MFKVSSFRSRHNAPAIAALVAIGKAHAKIPGVSPSRVSELAAKIERPLDGEQNAICIAALVVVLLKGLGAMERPSAGDLI